MHSLEALPAEPDSLAQSITHLTLINRSSASIRRAVAGISTIHLLNRMPDPSKDPDVVLEMKRMHRKLGRAASQAEGITRPILNQLLQATQNDTLGIRDRALLLVAYDTLCRRSGLVSLHIEDIKWVQKDGTENLILLLKRSKTDQESTSRWLHLSPQTQIALKDWLKLLDTNDGPIFRGITNTGKINANLSGGQINRI